MESGAATEVRTRDLYLGKVMLYQLSYCRVVVGGGLEPPTNALSRHCSTGLS